MIEALAGKHVIGVAAGSDHAGLHSSVDRGGRGVSSLPLGMETFDGWATEGNSMSLCRGWSRRCQQSM